MTRECDTKFEEKLTGGLENDMEEFGKFSPEHKKFSKLEFSMDSYIQSRKCMSLKLKEELCVITMNNDAKFEIQLTCHFIIDMRNLTNFDPSTQKSRKFALYCADFDQSIKCFS